MRRVVALFIFVLALATSACAESVTEARLRKLTEWVIEHSSYTDPSLPTVSIVPRAIVNEAYYGGCYKGQDNILAMQMGDIVLIAHGTLERRGDATLVHEIVHYQQYRRSLVTGVTLPGNVREDEAYEMEKKFVQETGRGYYEEPGNRVPISSCW